MSRSGREQCRRSSVVRAEDHRGAQVTSVPSAHRSSSSSRIHSVSKHQNGKVATLRTSVACYSLEVNINLAKPLLKFRGSLAIQGLFALVK